MTPLISVLMPVRNAEATLALSLESIRRQRSVSWECIVVDDGSNDGSRACLERAARLDSRVRLLAQPARGIVAALNAGLAECRGRYVARMDADDVMRRDRLCAQAALLDADPSLVGVGCHVRIFPRAALQTGRLEYEAWLNSLCDAESVARDAFVECPLAHPSFMLRRDVLERHAYQDRGWPEDYDLILRLLAQGLRLGVAPRRLLAWRDGAERLSRTSANYALLAFTACKAHYLARGLLARHPQYVLWGYGKTGSSLARALDAEGKHPCAIVEKHPGRIGQTIRGARVISPDHLTRLTAPGVGLPIVVSVARAGPRAEVRRALRALGFQELRDYVCAA
jgi:cellulose synthase/poly-beta-1,6-N-acetylglucosamine synthase-like glycosyltransferase